MNSYTHKYVTKTALELVNPNINIQDKNTIIDYSEKPDYDETEGTFKTHFYNVATKKNFRGERMSAYIKLQLHYINAQRDNDITELGRALHFAQDMSTPVHTYYEDTFDAVTRLKQHTNFEEFCDKIIKDNVFALDNSSLLSAINSLSKNAYYNLSIYYSMIASENFYNLDKDKKPINDIATESINNCIILSAHIIRDFFGM